MSPNRSYRVCMALTVLLLPATIGCCRSFWHSIPAQDIGGPGFMAAPRSSQEPINFVCLRQDPPPVYLLGPGDVLGMYVEGVLGQVDVPPPVHFPEQGNTPPAMGYPIPIREDGTLSLPLVPPINVMGLTLAQAERQIRRAYTVGQRILQPGRDRIIVTLMRPRTYQVTVIREDTGGPSLTAGNAKGELTLGSTKRGMSYTVELRAYENDVLHALSASGGLPGVDAKNELKILRGTFEDAQQRNQFLSGIEDPQVRDEVMTASHNTVTIPLRTALGQPVPNLTPNDVILNNGDIVFIESRDAEVFYTGGLLQGGQHPIPRDYDLDVLGAMAMAGGTIASAAGSSSSSSGFNGGGGMGALIPATRVIVVRTVNGKQISIRVDLKRALLDARERILIEPNDFILLEYTPCELLANIVLSNLQFNYILGGINR